MPPAAVAIGAGIGAIGSSVIGGIANKNAANKAANTAATNANRFLNIQDPDYEYEKLALDKLQNAGLLKPQTENAVSQNPTAFNDLQTDPRLKNAELSALGQLSSISNERGLDAGSLAKLAQAQESNAAAARGARDANLQNAAQRGVAGSGLEFVSNQLADQGAANQNALSGVNAAADANARQMAALSGLSNLSTTAQSNDFNQQAQVAKARDAINNFNASALQHVGDVNTQNQNAANQYNVSNAQRLSDANTAMANTQQEYNKQLEQQKFNNTLAKTQGAAGLTGQQVNAQLAGGQALGNIYGGLGQSLAGVAGKIYANQTPDPNDPNKVKQTGSA